MSRLAMNQGLGLPDTVQRLERQLAELKATPQPTSNRSGVLTYQVPVSDDWQGIEWKDHLDVIHYDVDVVSLEPLPNSSYMNRAVFECFYTPVNQETPVVYPFLHVQIDGMEWYPAFSPNVGSGFWAQNANCYISLLATEIYDMTDYSLDEPEYMWRYFVYYGTHSSSFRPNLRTKFRLRSTDKGSVYVRLKTFKDF